MLRDRLIDAATRLGIDHHLRELRATILPAYRRDRAEALRLRALLASLLTADANCIDIGAYRGRVLAELVYAASLKKRFPGVEVRQAAVSNQTGETTFTSRLRKPRPLKAGMNEHSFAGVPGGDDSQGHPMPRRYQ